MDELKISPSLEPNKYKSRKSSTPVSLDQVKDLIRVAKEEVRIDTEKLIGEQVQTDKASLITVFGIFASIISFLTIEFQFLKTLCSIEKIAGFSLLLFSLLISFNISLDYLIKSRNTQKPSKPNILYSSFIALIFLVGIGLIYLGNEEKCHDNKIYERYSESFQSELKDYKRQTEELNKRVDTLTKELELYKGKQ